MRHAAFRRPDRRPAAPHGQGARRRRAGRNESAYDYGNPMEAFINRTPVAIDAELTLADLLAREGIAAEGIAVAVDNKVVPRTAWNTTRLQEGAKITVIRAVCGG